MNEHAIDAENVASQIQAGQCAIVAALVIALHENGVLPQGRYTDVLQRLWSRMPEEEAVGETGAVIEQMLDLLGTHAFAAFPSDGAEPMPETLAPPRTTTPRTAPSCAVLR